MTGYICPMCFFRRTYQTTQFENSKCIACRKETTQLLCSSCSVLEESCKRCDARIREGSSYSNGLDEIETHLTDIMRLEPGYKTILDHLRVRRKVYMRANRDSMLRLCLEK